MSAEWLFVVGTALSWVGWLAVARGAYVGLRWMFGRETGTENARRRAIVKSAAVAAVCLLVASFVPMTSGRPSEDGWAVPLVWFLMPFQMVGALACLAFAGARCVQSVTAITAEERRTRLGALAVWLVCGALFYWWFLETKGEVQVFRGVIYASPTKLLTVVLLAVVAVSVMVWTEKMARARGLLKKAVVHVVLIAGCIVFGIPFAWLLVTSFKEEQDISTAKGMVWVPRVQLTVPFHDEKRPLFEAHYRGRSVLGTVVQAASGGRLLFEIERPFNIRGRQFETERSALREVPRQGRVVAFEHEGQRVQGYVVEEVENGAVVVKVQAPASLEGQTLQRPMGETEPVREVGLRTANYSEMLEWLPWDTFYGLAYLKNTLVLVVMSVIGTVLSSLLVGYGFSRLRFPGRNQLFIVMLATMMLPAAVTMLPTFLIFRSLGWIDTLYPLWVPTFFAAAFNVFLLRQFFKTIPMELEDAAKIDGCGYLRTLFQVMVPQIQPVLACIAIWTFMGQWNNFMGPLIYVSTPEKMPIAYALQMFQGERGGEFALMMSFATLATIPTVLLFFFAQRYFIEGVHLSGLGGK
ncbi:MAG: carbohydrate ABC transporter permease [Fimbriimonadaceae bacterium]